MKCRLRDLYVPPKYFCPYFWIFGFIIPQNALIILKLGKTLDLKGTNLDVKDEYKDYLFISIIWGILNISLNCPNAVNTFKKVWILTEMTSGPPRPWLFQIINIGVLTFLFAFTRWQICWALMKIWRFQKIESHAVLLHFAFNKTLMQTEIYLPTKLMVLIITSAD